MVKSSNGIVQWSNPLHHFANEAGHDGLSLVGRLLHFLVADLHGHIEAAEVGDDADAEGADAAVVRHDDFGHGAHTDGVTAEQRIHSIFGWCLEGRTLHTHVNAMDEANFLLFGDFVGHFDEFGVIDLVHVGESRTSRVVRAIERMLGEHVDVVGDDHQVADAEHGVHTARCVRHEERVDAQFVHDTNRERHVLHAVALVEVEAAFHGHDILLAEFAENEFSTVSFDG